VLSFLALSLFRIAPSSCVLTLLGVSFILSRDFLQVRMNVVGRRCSHFQQAVAIDAEAQKLVVLGSVRQSVVATPDLGPA
jgi:hypothetical protein